jgi:hypothetical protein
MYSYSFKKAREEGTLGEYWQLDHILEVNSC